MGFRSTWPWFQIEFWVVGFRWPWGHVAMCGRGFCSSWAILGLMGFACRGHRGSWV